MDIEGLPHAEKGCTHEVPSLTTGIWPRAAKLNGLVHAFTHLPNGLATIMHGVERGSDGGCSAVRVKELPLPVQIT
eukprot:4596509-Amphidinium_carterae.1